MGGTVGYRERIRSRIPVSVIHWVGRYRRIKGAGRVMTLAWIFSLVGGTVRCRKSAGSRRSFGNLLSVPRYHRERVPIIAARSISYSVTPSSYIKRLSIYHVFAVWDSREVKKQCGNNYH